MRLGKYLTICLALLVPVWAWATACPSGAAKTYAVVVPHQNVPSNQTNFPVPICFNGLCTNSITLAQLKDTGHSGLVNNTAANSSGVTGAADVWFCDSYSGGNLIKFENSYYDGTTGKGIWWYQKTLSSSSDNFVYMNVGKSSQSTSLQDLSLWNDVGYLWVIHGSNPSTLERAESVGFLGTKTTTGTVTATSGPLGGAFVFAGSGNLQYGRSASTDAANSWAYEQWIKPSATATMIIQDQGPGSGCSTPAFLSALVISNNLQTDACYSSADHGVISSGSVGTGSWVYAVGGSQGGSPGTFRSYLNGVADGATANFASPYSLSTNDVYIGRTSSGANAYSGQMFELRKSNQLYSADWYKTNYLAMTSPSGFNVLIDMSSPSGLASGTNCVPIQIPASQIPNTDRTNYIFTFFGKYPWMADVANGGYAVTGNSGHDIRWYSDSSCTSTLSFTRVFWDNTTGYSLFNVLIPTVSHTTTTTIYQKIGATGDTTDLSATVGSYNSAVINYMPWGSPTSFSNVSSGADGRTFSNGGTPQASVGPMGTAMYLDGSSYVNFTPSTPFLLSTFGYPVGSSVGSVTVWFRATPDTAAQLASQSGGAWGGYGCTLHAGGCSSTSTDGARVLEKRKPAFGNECGMNIGTYDNGDPSVSTNCLSATTDFQWHRLTFVYTPSSAQINAGTVLLILDGVAQSPTYVSGTTVLHTTDGGLSGASEVNWGRDAAHGGQKWLGYIGPPAVFNTALSADDDATYYNNGIAPFNFYAFGTATQPSPPAGSTQQLIPGIITRNWDYAPVPVLASMRAQR